MSNKENFFSKDKFELPIEFLENKTKVLDNLKNDLELEKTIDKEIFHGLKEIGHNVEYFDGTHGGGQAIKINRSEGDLLGGSDPRKDGYAKGY